MGNPQGLLIEVAKIEGHCPVYRKGFTFRIEEGYKLIADGPLCMHSLQSLAPYYVSLSQGIDPAELGLAGPDGVAYVQCLDPQEITGGGTVTFRITRKADSEDCGGPGFENRIYCRGPS